MPIQQLTRDLADRIIDDYGRAWTQRDDSLLPLIFTDDVVYKEGLNEPMVGLSSVEGYWRTKVKGDQSNIQFERIKDVVQGNTIVARWRAEFDSIREGHVRLEETAWIEVRWIEEDGRYKISKLEETYAAVTETEERYVRMLQERLGFSQKN